MDGCPLGLGLVVEDKPTEFSCTQATQNPFYLHVGSHILESLEKHAKARYTVHAYITQYILTVLCAQNTV